MAIFKFNNDNFEEIEKTSFEKENILERQHIQNALKKQIGVITSDILIIAEEVCQWNDSKKRIDLLGVDKSGNIVVIELKRTETGEHMDLQAIRYASMISTLTFSKAVDIYSEYLSSIENELNAKDELSSFIDDDIGNFASNVRIILVASDFSKELTTSVMWLNERNLDIQCHKLVPYKLNDEILVDVRQIIPLPDIESYQVQVREQKEEKRQTLKGTRDKTRYNFNGETNLGKRGLVRNVWLRYIKDTQEISYEKLIKDFPNDIKGSKLFVELEQVKDKTRYFIEEGELLKIGNKTYVISNQWNKEWIDKFVKYAKKLGYDIQEN